MTHDELVIKLLQLETQVGKLEKSTSLFVEEHRVPDGWCQICGMKKASCLHAGSL